MASRERLSLVVSRRAVGLRAVADVSTFGFVNYTTASWPDRVYARLDAAERPPSVLHGEPEIDVEHVATPLEYLGGVAALTGSAWPTETRRSVARLEALWLLTEDRHRLLDTSAIEPLAHQASLVEFLLSTPGLDRVLIGDEVGLGKTLEAGILIKRLAERSAGTFRVLYLTEARLVTNVIEEFRKLELRPREWSARVQEAKLTPGDSDPLVVASMHRAVVNAEAVGNSGPWDVLVVDEAHHLTDWSSEGTDPQQRMRLVRRIIKSRLAPGGRVILLSGTPHQGSEERFNNLLKLISSDDGNARGARGRIIYRIKDDIRDWDGRPLFPKRLVRPPTEVDGGAEYSEWLHDVHELLTPSASSRAGGWRRAQALQWCASSPHAGLGYLVRLALRAGLRPGTISILKDAIAALRPYRGGQVNEPVELLADRIMGRLAALDEDEEEVFSDGREGLKRVLRQGVTLVQNDALGRKLDRVFGWLNENPEEKFVVFAQPVETVFMLRYRLEQQLGAGAVALIVGEQKPEERQREIERFWADAKARVLISSRSGGEGINLQVARRLVHFDVPWNPMEMEQRVGRIHRYGSAQTVIVDTLVLKDSRELRVLARARARLGKIIRDIDRERFDLLYSRTMALIPLDELASLMAGENFGPLTQADEQRIDTLIQEGYHRWLSKDQEFRGRSERLNTLERGPTTRDDFRAFLVGTLGASPEGGWQRRVLEEAGNGGEPRVREEAADVVRMPDGTLGYIGRDAGIGLLHPGNPGIRPRPVGLNDPSVVSMVRSVIDAGSAEQRSSTETRVSGAGALLLPSKEWSTWAHRWAPELDLDEGAVFTAYLRRYLETGAEMRETETRLCCWISASGGNAEAELGADAIADFIRLIRQPRSKRTRPSALSPQPLLARETQRLVELRSRQPGEPTIAAFPVAAFWIEPTDDRGSGGDV